MQVEPKQITDMAQIPAWRARRPRQIPKNYERSWMFNDAYKSKLDHGLTNFYSRLWPDNGFGFVLASCSLDGEFMLWDANEQKIIHPLPENESNPVGVGQEPRWISESKIVYHFSGAVWIIDIDEEINLLNPRATVMVSNIIDSKGEGSASEDGRFYPIKTGIYDGQNYGDFRVGIVDLVNEAVTHMPIDYGPNGLDVTPDGKFLHVLDHEKGRMTKTPIDDGRIHPEFQEVINADFRVGHSGYGFEENGDCVAVWQNNDNDLMEKYNFRTGEITPVAHMSEQLKMWQGSGVDYHEMGFHVAKCSSAIKNWCLVSTYAKEDFNSYANSIYFLKLDGSAEIRKLCRTGNLFRGYHSESAAALSRDGKRIYWGANDNATRNVELMSVELPANWDGSEPVKPVDPPGPWKKHSQYGGYDVYVETEYIGQPDYYWKWRDD